MTFIVFVPPEDLLGGLGFPDPSRSSGAQGTRIEESAEPRRVNYAIAWQPPPGLVSLYTLPMTWGRMT